MQRTVLILTAFLLFVPALSAARTLEVRKGLKGTDLTPYLSYYVDENGTATMEELRVNPERMKPLESVGPDLGMLSSPVWFRLNLENREPFAIMTHLMVMFPQLDEIVLFEPDKNGTYKRTVLGDNLPYSQRPVMTRYFTVPVRAPSGVTQYFIRVNTTSVVTASFKIMGPAAHLEYLHREQVIIGLFYGLALGLFLYNLLLFVVTREKTYAWFSGFVLFSTVYLANLDGMTYQLWPDAIYWHNRSIFVMVMLSIASMIMFQRSYLGLISNNFLDRINQVLMVLSLMWVPLILISHVRFGLQLVALFMPIAFFYQVIVGLVHLRRGTDMAIYYLMAWTGMVILVVLSALAARGTIPGFHFLGAYGLKVGLVMVMILLSIGMGHRINLLKKAGIEEHGKMVAARAESEAKSLFLARMSHELRTPMNAVLGASELLRDTELNEEQIRYLEAIHGSGDALLTTINDILDFSKLQAGRMELDEVDFNLKDLFDEVTHIFKTSNTNPDLHFSSWIRSGTPVRYRGDRVRIRQVLLNLVGNAGKFTEKGSVTIRASSESLEDGRIYVKIEVWDTGVGISTEDRERLFQPFTQADVSTSRKYGGTGLGLSISKQLAILMGGDIEVRSQVGQGSCFSFGMIVKQATTLMDKKSSSHEDIPILEGMRVLVAEDNKVNRMVIKGLLRKLGVDVIFAEDGKIALQTYGSNPDAIDLILMDCEMPEMDGYTATREIRKVEQKSGLEPVPIVALTAHALDVHRRQCMEAGMTSFLSKPVKKNVLARELGRLFNGPVIIDPDDSIEPMAPSY